MSGTLRSPPRSIIIAGGGYIACELAHFFSSLGVEVTVVSRSPRLLRHAEPEVSETLTQALRMRMRVKTSTEVVEVREAKGVKEVTVKEAKGPRRLSRLKHSSSRGNTWER